MRWNFGTIQSWRSSWINVDDLLQHEMMLTSHEKPTQEFVVSGSTTRSFISTVGDENMTFLVTVRTSVMTYRTFTKSIVTMTTSKTHPTSDSLSIETTLLSSLFR